MGAVAVALVVVGLVAGAPDDGVVVRESERADAPFIDDDAGAAIADDEETEEDAEPEDTAPTSTEYTLPDAPTIGAPGGSAVPVGTVVELDDGTVVRVNAVTPDAPPRFDYIEPDPGFTFTEAELELCAGPRGAFVYSRSLMAFLDDHTEAEVSIGSDLRGVELSPGGCTRGFVVFHVPAGATVADIVFTDDSFTEVARWSVASAVPVDAPLQPAQSAAATPVGTAVELGEGATAVVRSVTADATPVSDDRSAPAGYQLVELDVEVCAGTDELRVSPRHWLVTAQDHYTGGGDFATGTLPPLDVAPGQCVAGTVQVSIPESSTPGWVVLTGELFDEEARWVLP